MAIFRLRGRVIPLRTTLVKRAFLGIDLYRKDKKSDSKWLSHGNFPMRGFMIPLRTIWDKRGSLGIYFYQKDQQSVNKWLSYGNFSPERLRDSIENHIGKKASGCSFVP